MNSIKQYIKNLFPWRWIYPAIFMFLTGIVISMGVGSEDPLNRVYFKYPVLFDVGNILYWFFIDYVFGLGQRNIWERNKEI